MLCSVFVPEPTFSNTTQLRLVEGLSTVLRHRWEAVSVSAGGIRNLLNSWQQCSICERTDGAVVRCSDCSKEFHVSCAWKQGYKFGFEIQHVSLFTTYTCLQGVTLVHQVKSSRRDLTVTTTFKTETGCMNAIISCKDHDHSRRVIYDICETNEGGEVCSFRCYRTQWELKSISCRLRFKCIAGHINKHPSD